MTRGIVIGGGLILTTLLVAEDVGSGVKGSAPVSQAFFLGVEIITADYVQKVAQTKKRPRVGLITNQTSRDQAGMRTIDVLLKKDISVVRLFAPEHGLEGNVHASQEIYNSIDKKTGIPVVSLFKSHGGKHLDAHSAKGLDVLIFDMQDAGMRHFTYVSTLYQSMQAAALYKKPLIVLDRPNPLGARMEGPLVDPLLKSFIAIAPIPLRHGMTIGELARYFNAYGFKKTVNLHVVAMRDYDRSAGFIGLWNAKLSPHIKTKEACYGYSLLGLLGEVRPFDCGLGTEKAMRVFALPEKGSASLSAKAWQELSIRLQQSGLSTIAVSYYSPRKKTQCHGLQLKISDGCRFSSFNALLTILDFVNKKGIPLTFSPAFDTAAGTAKVREYIQGISSRAVLVHAVNTGIQKFYDRAQAVLLYQPVPQLGVVRDKVI